MYIMSRMNLIRFDYNGTGNAVLLTKWTFGSFVGAGRPVVVHDSKLGFSKIQSTPFHDSHHLQVNKFYSLTNSCLRKITLADWWFDLMVNFPVLNYWQCYSEFNIRISFTNMISNELVFVNFCPFYVNRDMNSLLKFRFALKGTIPHSTFHWLAINNSPIVVKSGFDRFRSVSNMNMKNCSSCRTQFYSRMLI